MSFNLEQIGRAVDFTGNLFTVSIGRHPGFCPDDQNRQKNYQSS
jgi:hypothetical protein